MCVCGWVFVRVRACVCVPACVCVCRLQQCDVWAQSEVLRVLQRYQPSSEEELFDILSVLDPSLLSPHPPLVAATLALFLGLCSSLPAAGVSALERAQGPLLAACGSSCREMRFSALCHIQVCLSVCVCT